MINSRLLIFLLVFLASSICSIAKADNCFVELANFVNSSKYKIPLEQKLNQIFPNPPKLIKLHKQDDSVGVMRRAAGQEKTTALAKTRTQELTNELLQELKVGMNVYVQLPGEKFLRVGTKKFPATHTMAAGTDVISAGEIYVRINRFGKKEIYKVKNQSGYYHPPRDSLATTVLALADGDLILARNLTIVVHYGPKITEEVLHINMLNRTKPFLKGMRRKKLVVEEVPRAGVRLEKTLAKELENGEYIYIVFFNRNTLSYETYISPTLLPDDKKGRYYVAHRSIYRKHNKKHLSVVAAGEFFIKHSELAKLSNKSGTFMGEEEHLKIALEQFAVNGFVTDQTRLVDFDQLYKAAIADRAAMTERFGISSFPEPLITKENAVHSEAIERVQSLRSLKGTPFYHELENLMEHAYRIFPAEDAGYVDRSKIAKYVGPNVLPDEVEQDMAFFVWMLIKNAQEDSIAWSLSQYTTKESIQNVRDQIKWFHTFLDRYEAGTL